MKRSAPISVILLGILGLACGGGQEAPAPGGGASPPNIVPLSELEGDDDLCDEDDEPEDAYHEGLDKNDPPGFRHSRRGRDEEGRMGR